MNNTNQDVTKAVEASVIPFVDIHEDATGVTLFADMPGVTKDKLQMHVEEDTLTIEGEMSLDFPAEMRPAHVELSAAHFKRIFSLSKDLNAEKIVAEFNNGVLQLRIPKVEAVQPKRLEIKVE